MTIQSISTVYFNLHCLQAVEDQGKDLGAALTPCAFGGSLYRDGVIKGLYDFFYSRCGEEKKRAAFQRVMEMTYRSLQHYLTAELTEWEQIEYQNFFYGFVKQELLPNRDRYIRIFQETLGKDGSLLFQNLYLRNRFIKQQNHLRRFEQISGCPIPRDIFHTIYQGWKMTIKEQAALRNWIKNINYKSTGSLWLWDRLIGDGTPVTCTDLLRVLKMVAEEFRQDTDMGDEHYLVLTLDRFGIDLFQEPDPQFLKKRKKWVERGVVSQKQLDKTIRLELGDRRCDLSLEQNWVFDLIQPKGKFVVISDNPAGLQIDEFAYREKWVKSRRDRYLGQPPVALLSYDPVLSGDGFWVFDRFDYRMSDSPWKVSKEYANSIVRFFLDMLKNHYTPGNLSSAHLGWIDQRLYTTQVLTIQCLDMGFMAKSLRDWTEGADDVYRYILEEAGLLEGSEQEFFLAILDDQVDETQLSTDAIREKHFIGGPLFLRSCHWIWPAVDQFQDDAMRLIDEIHQEHPEAERKKIACRVKDHYVKTWSFGAIDFTWKDEITAKLV